MLKDFDKFMSQLKETNATLDFYTDFNKIRRNVQNIEISLNMLNFLLGKDDLYSAVKALWDRDPKVFNVLDILIATRREGKKKFIDVDGEIKLIKTLFSSVDGIMKFFNETGLADFFKNKDVHDLVIMFLELKQVLIHMRERIEVEMLQNHYYIEFCKQMAFLMAQRFIPLNTMN